jgi:hypothetical protein
MRRMEGNESDVPRRRTEQDDELPEHHSLAEKYGQPERPYVPPRQPVQDQSEEEPLRGAESGRD